MSQHEPDATRHKSNTRQRESDRDQHKSKTNQHESHESKTGLDDEKSKIWLKEKNKA